MVVRCQALWVYLVTPALQALPVLELPVLQAPLDGQDSPDLLVPLVSQDTLVALDYSDLLEVQGFLALLDRKVRLEILVILVQLAAWDLSDDLVHLVETVLPEALEQLDCLVEWDPRVPWDSLAVLVQLVPADP